MPVIHELIELPSEANPLNPQTLFKVLSGATSTDQQQVKTAALQLQNWEKEPGYYSGLQTVLIDTSLPFEVRYLAVIQIKNGIDKYWRKTAQKPISKEEKALIRSRCLELGVSEPDHRLALHNAIVISKIARFEYPHDWPDVITSVTNFLQESSRTDSGSAHLPRTLLILLYIIKELSTAKLQRSRINLQKAAPDIFRVLSHVYLEKVNKWMNFLMTGGNNEADAINSIDLSLLSLRVLRRLIICGFDNPNRHDEIQEFWNMIRVHFGEMLALVTQHGQSLQDHIRGQIEKHLIQMSKFHLEMARVHPAAYPQLQGAIEIAKAYWGLLVEFGKTFGTDTAIMTAIIGTDGDAEDEISCIEKLSLKGLLLIRACTKMVYTPTQTFKYQSAADKVERKESTDSMKSKLLSQDLVREMMETLVTRFFVFRLRDLRQWEEEPGEWERREEGEGETWEFSIRTCAEKLFLELVINNKDLLIQPLLSVFHTVASM